MTIFLSTLLIAGCGKLKISYDGENDRPGTDVGTNPDADRSRFDQGTNLDGGTAPRDGGDDPTGDTANDDDPDASGEDDAGDDVGPLCTIGGEECGAGASCVGGECVCDDGLLGDPYTGCAAENPCEGVDCPAGSSCSANGMCECDPFFSDDGNGNCVPVEPAADLSTRTKTDVCDIWTSTYQRSSSDFFMIEPIDTCDPGVLHPEEQRTALHRTSVFRQLVGLYPVSLDANRTRSVQDCAMMHAANDTGLDHEPPDTWECYTQEGAAGAGSSNLAVGRRIPAATVGLYVGDIGVASLGHRRWVFNPGMAATAFGHRESYGCMYSFGGGRNHNPEYVAYPSAGAFPRGAILGKWSIHGGGSWSADHTVTITNMSDNSDVPVSNVTAPVFGFLASTLSWSVDTRQLPVDTDYKITLADPQGNVVQEYTTHLVDCN